MLRLPASTLLSRDRWYRVCVAVRRARRSRPTSDQHPLFLASAGVIDFHGLLFLAAAVFVPFKTHMVVVGDLNYLANWCFHSRHHFDFAGIRECLGRGIVGAFGELNASVHVV